MQKGTQMPKHSNAGGGVKSRPQSSVNPYPKVNTGAIRSDSHAKDDKLWSADHAKMRAEAHEKGRDRSNLPLQGVPGGDNLKGGK